MSTLGYKHTPEGRAKISAANLGRTFSPESRAKISAAKFGRKHSPETREKISQAVKGKNTGEKNPRWCGGRRINSLGYVLVLRPRHPFADKNGWVRKSHLVMERHIGRFILPEEVVHHKGKKDDDRIKKLRLFPSQGDHMHHHKSEREKSCL